jgi:hypothetical protein
MKAQSLLLAAAAALAMAGSASAHHSFAMFDMTKELTFDATVKDVHWSNPHVWIDVMAAKPNGPSEPWGIEAGATNTLTRQGWKRDSLKPGDKIKVQAHPMRNGTADASLIQITTADGQILTLGSQGARPGG